ncbi:MAG: glycosyltransferase family 2 protein [Brevinema sp.]
MSIAIIIPCYNEEITIKKVINDMRGVLTEASIHVFDNNSADNTYQIAVNEGVFVHHSPYQGKGNVLRHAFSIVDADFYIIADGDDQCDTSIIPKALEKMTVENLDMLSLVRVEQNNTTYRTGHKFGNKLLNKLVKLFFNVPCSDVLGGYRIFSKAFVKSFPAHSKGFEIEVDLTVFAHQMRCLTGEMNVRYRARPEGSFSKLNTIRDGLLILKTIFYLFTYEKPLIFFGVLSSFCGVIGIGWLINLYLEFLEITAVPRFPSLICVSLLLLLSCFFLITGIILSYLKLNILEQRRYQYIKYKSKE